MRKSVSKKKKFIFWGRIFSGVFFAALFFLSVSVASAQLAHTDVFTCTPSGSIPANTTPCPNAETPLVKTYTCAFGEAPINYCPGVNFIYCDDRKLVASCSGAIASGEYICKSGYTFDGGVCVKNCVCASTLCVNESCVDQFGNTCPGIIPIIGGSCGTANRTYDAYEENWGSDTFCTIGSPDPLSPAFPLPRSSTSWTCSGICGGNFVSCSATREAQSFWREVAP